MAYGIYPVCGGHEGAGTIVQVGPDTTGWDEGDRVVLSFLPIREVSPDEAGPVLKRYARLAPSARPYFQATRDSPAEDFIAQAARHPVFELTAAGEDRQRDHPGR